ncbi:hypothetical protein [Mesorhizobium sp. WSM2239]|uniref:Glycine-rich domain-containing protein n=2 Tax=unclassified Mesorhizobium TaxID=325217 RepID=A0AAU8D1Z9_9HYPH
MSIFTKLANVWASPFNADGTSRQIAPKDMQVWGTEIERLIAAVLAAGGKIYEDKAAMDADAAPAIDTPALVLGDATQANNGLYRKSSAAGVAGWTREGDVPGYGVVKFANAGAGTADAIVATATGPVYTTAGAQLYSVNITAANTGNVTLNGIPLLTNSGNQIAAGGLTIGMNPSFSFDGTSYRLLSDQANAAIQAAAEAAAVLAEAWAEGTEPDGPGTKSAREYALEAATYSGDLIPELVTAATYTPVIGDATSKIKRLSDPTGVALTIPANADVAFDLGTVLTFEQVAAGQITVAGGVGVTVRFPDGVIAKSASEGAVFQAVKMATDEWTLLGALESSQIGYLLGSRQIFTTSGTWTKPAGCRAVMIEIVGGGGGGGGAADSTTGNACAGGGGGGQYGKKWITSALGATETVTRGAGGAGGLAGNNNGSAGTASSFGSHASVNGGSGGTGSSASTGTLLNTGGAGGTGGTGSDFQIRGGAGGPGIVSAGLRIPTGSGGETVLGSRVGQPTNNIGTAGQNYGGGGSGAVGAAAAARAGGNGADGIVIVWEYY